MAADGFVTAMIRCAHQASNEMAATTCCACVTLQQAWMPLPPGRSFPNGAEKGLANVIVHFSGMARAISD